MELGKPLANQERLEYVEAVEHLHTEVARLSDIVEADKHEPMKT